MTACLLKKRYVSFGGDLGDRGPFFSRLSLSRKQRLESDGCSVPVENLWYTALLLSLPDEEEGHRLAASSTFMWTSSKPECQTGLKTHGRSTGGISWVPR